MTGYIEQMGTGTTDIIERCNKAGLRIPEFIQDEDFLTILWRPESAHEKEQVREHEREYEKDHVTNILTNKRIFFVHCVGWYPTSGHLTAHLLNQCNLWTKENI